MKSKKSGAKVSQDMVRSEKPVLGWEDVNALAERSDIARPDGAGIAVNCEVKARVKNIAAAAQATKPSCVLWQAGGGVDELKNLGREALAGVEARERNVELLESAAE